jgi:hypothetical protein
MIKHIITCLTLICSATYLCAQIALEEGAVFGLGERLSSGEKTGVWTYYYKEESTELYAKGNFCNDKLCGEWTCYDEYGLQKFTIIDSLHFTRNIFYDTGELKGSCQHILDTVFVKEFFKNGQLAGEVVYIKKGTIAQLREELREDIPENYDSSSTGGYSADVLAPLDHECSDVDAFSDFDFITGFYYERIKYKYYNEKGEEKTWWDILKDW